MNNSKLDKHKLNSFAVVRPKKQKEIIIFILMILVLLGGIAPFINWVNLPVLILGVPSIMFFSVSNAVLVIIVLVLANKWGVH